MIIQTAIMHRISPMQNRRNFYRILQVQPDAPFEIIKSNYRTLLQKLRLHPDLGGEHWNASHINQAWHTLRDPVQRADYDKQLLQDYHIQIISQGHLAGDPNTHNYDDRHKTANSTNQRNYYRILNIQPDAPPAIISASYQLLIKKPHVPFKLIQEAYAVLSNPEKRKTYDRFLKNHTHINALKKKKAVAGKPPVLVKKTAKPPTIPPSASNSLCNTFYQPLITHYCHFCKTPHAINSMADQNAACIECTSPLFSTPYEAAPEQQRSLSRINRHSHLTVFLNWPCDGYKGALTNLSPGGVGFTSTKKLQPGQIIKIDSEHFKCVAKVTHSQKKITKLSIGSRFITVSFNRQQGTFVSTHA